MLTDAELAAIRRRDGNQPAYEEEWNRLVREGVVGPESKEYIWGLWGYFHDRAEALDAERARSAALERALAQFVEASEEMLEDDAKEDFIPLIEARQALAATARTEGV